MSPCNSCWWKNRRIDIVHWFTFMTIWDDHTIPPLKTALPLRVSWTLWSRQLYANRSRRFFLMMRNRLRDGRPAEIMPKLNSATLLIHISRFFLQEIQLVGWINLAVLQAGTYMRRFIFSLVSIWVLAESVDLCIGIIRSSRAILGANARATKPRSRIIRNLWVTSTLSDQILPDSD